MKSIIIGIHGLGNKPSQMTLQRWWKSAIQEGLNNISQPRKFLNLKLVYYAKHLYKKPQSSWIKNEKHPRYLGEPYVPDTENIKPFKPKKFKRRLLQAISKKLDALFFDENSIINFNKIADYIIRKKFRDLDTYYNGNAYIPKLSQIPIKNILRKELAKILKRHKNKRILLISHSMGTIVAYDVLTQSVPHIKIHTLMTMGSPLGLPLIIKKILREQGLKDNKKRKPRVPPNIQKAWYNFSDLDDKIAINYNLKDDFKSKKGGVRPKDIMVHNTYEYNGKKNPHKAFGYLRSPEVSRIIAEFLSYREKPLLRRFKEKFFQVLREGL